MTMPDHAFSEHVEGGDLKSLLLAWQPEIPVEAVEEISSGNCPIASLSQHGWLAGKSALVIYQLLKTISPATGLQSQNLSGNSFWINNPVNNNSLLLVLGEDTYREIALF